MTLAEPMDYDDCILWMEQDPRSTLDTMAEIEERIDDTIAAVERDGLRIYGIATLTSKEGLLQMRADEAVEYLYVGGLNDPIG